MNTTKPIFRATIYVLEERKRDIRKSYIESFNCEPPENLTQEIDSLIGSLKAYINKL